MALVGAVVAVIAGEGGAAASAPAAGAPAKAPPPSAAPNQRRAKDRFPASAGMTDRRTSSHTPSSTRSSRSARRRATSARRRPPAARRHAAGAPPRRRERHRSLAHLGLRPAWPHRRRRRRRRHRQRRRPRRAAGRPAPPPTQVKALYHDVEFEEVPLDGMRATIARRLVEAKQTIPHFYLTADVTMDALLKIREEANAGAPKGAAYKLSVNDFVIKALALALAARARRERGLGGRPHPALQAFRRRRRGRDRRRPDHAGDPHRRSQIAVRDLQRDEGPRRARQGEEAQARRISGRLVGDLQSRHVRRARVLGDHQPAARDHPCGRRRAAPPGRGGRRR